MRKIEYRGKRIDNGEWVFGFLDYRNDGFFIHVVDDIAPTYADPGGDKYSEYFEVDPKTIGEYIGLKDNKKRDIYEGDKIRHSLWGIFTIVWDDISAGFRAVDGKGGDLNMGHAQLKRCRIIGDIYESL